MRFAELHGGQELEFGSVMVDEHDIIEFATRYDPQPFHVDPVAAAASRWRGVIASGFHTCSIAMRMIVDHVLSGSESCGSPGIEYVRWPNPVCPGDQLRMRVHVLQADRSKSGRMGVVRWQWLLLNQTDQTVLDLVVTSLFSLENDTTAPSVTDIHSRG
jgi:acyl dehydratase